MLFTTVRTRNNVVIFIILDAVAMALSLLLARVASRGRIRRADIRAGGVHDGRAAGVAVAARASSSGDPR